MHCNHPQYMTKTRKKIWSSSQETVRVKHMEFKANHNNEGATITVKNCFMRGLCMSMIIPLTDFFLLSSRSTHIRVLPLDLAMRDTIWGTFVIFFFVCVRWKIYFIQYCWKCYFYVFNSFGVPCCTEQVWKFLYDFIQRLHSTQNSIPMTHVGLKMSTLYLVILVIIIWSLSLFIWLFYRRKTQKLGTSIEKEHFLLV